MGIHTLKYESREKCYVLDGRCDPHSDRIGRWQVSERYEPGIPPKPERGRYRIMIETDVTDVNDLSEAASEAYGLADELDVAWCYVFGEPYSAYKLQLCAIEGPEHWTGNHREVADAAEAEQAVRGKVSINAVSWVKGSFLPLSRLLAVRVACRSASPIIQELIGLHVASHRVERGGAMMLAKALEVAGKYYGATRAARNMGLQNEMIACGVAHQMKRSVGWLFDTANTRFDIRHAIDKDAPGVALHPKLTPEELRDFDHDANLVIRAFVCQKLGLTVYTVIPS